jgi:hypothetical protein|tara:strand:- start:7583 stop:8044 length:462 start_codon:yes stop_codon:yes gene_type:complete
MKIEVIHSKIAYSERTLICVPCAKFRATEHPIREVRAMFPIEYRHFREHCEDERREHDSEVLLGRGKFLLSDFGEQKICWMTVQNRHNNYFQYEWLEEVLDAMVEAKLHHKYDMAFPGLGYYDEDGLDMADTLKMVFEKFRGSAKGLDFHVGY